MKKNMRTGIILLLYSRPDHTRKVLEALEKYKVEDLVIYMDAPGSKEVEEKQQELLELVDGITWTEYKLIRRPEPVGLARSIIESVTEQLEEYEQVILLEDDCVPREGFFEFMFSSLDKYRDDKRIRSVCAYQFPFADFTSDFVEGVLIRRFMPWGWATWRDRWVDYEKNTKKLIEELQRSGIFEDLPDDVKKYGSHDDILNGNRDIWSINWVLTHYLTNTLTLFPSVSLIDNIGFDGTGVNCSSVKLFNNDNYYSGGKSLKLEGGIALNHDYDNLVKDFLKENYKEIVKLIL